MDYELVLKKGEKVIAEEKGEKKLPEILKECDAVARKEIKK